MMNSIEAFRQFADTSQFLVIGSSLFERESEEFHNFLKGQAVFLIADGPTMKAAGEAFLRFCSAQNIEVAGQFVFPDLGEVTSEYGNVALIRDKMEKTRAVPVAVGSGTINDLVKRASFELERPYAVIATAASVDGYSSDGAALLYKGLKQTMRCDAPAFIAADTTVLMDAPFHMTAAGYADLLAKNPAGSDWIIADAVNLDPIEADVWKAIQGNLAKWTDNPSRLVLKDTEAYDNLFTGLNATGFAMQYLKRSRPASGAEHLLSHIWEMEGHTHKGKQVSHGFKVAIGSLASVAMTEALFSLDFTDEHIPAAVAGSLSLEEELDLVQQYFKESPACGDIETIFREKYTDPEKLKKRLNLLADQWPVLKERVLKQLIPYGEYKKKFSEAHCPVRPEDVGLSIEKVLETVKPAQLIRNRYTILDLVVDTGMLDKVLDIIRNSSEYLK
jgi:glycerol-1-phosphate dehydrogenase [NAD(P)+]